VRRHAAKKPRRPKKIREKPRNSFGQVNQTDEYCVQTVAPFWHLCCGVIQVEAVALEVLWSQADALYHNARELSSQSSI
jgi:hypothetical protein